MSNTTTSARGRAALKLEEGDVLKAYRCPAGRWTIGVGLTKASGVVDPKPGMKITAEKSDELLSQALALNYEPAVRTTMPGALQNEFDGAVSFHFNTGAIKRASWVKAWKAKNWSRVKSGLAAWKKGGGKVLPGLVKRRQREFDMIRHSIYPVPVPATTTGLARIIVPLGAAEHVYIHSALSDQGYDPGSNVRYFRKEAIEKFQRDHDLTVDGIIGRATLSTLQRMIDARAKVKAPVAVAAASGGIEAVPVSGATLPELTGLPGAEWIAPAVLALAVVWLAWRAWHYRDAIAVKTQTRFPKITAKLRSIK
ncbi:glycoside hydrolase family protein [Thalassovita sp.]|uniref:glycoside hydrolase family protein n=1 Tax=Thalassovita sp. TaxID=1979401 RepID=UPI002B26EA26|nr:glycoside hydrolase family protein [Thalassovita sp.]